MTQTQRKIHFTAVNHAIARLTAESGVNNQKLSVAAGFNPTFIWYIMNGKRGLTTETLTQLASHFAKVLARPLPDLILEILGVNPDGTLTDGLGGALDATPAHLTPGTVALLPIEPAPLLSKKDAAKLDEAIKGFAEDIWATHKNNPANKPEAVAKPAKAKTEKAAKAKPTGKKLEVAPVPVAKLLAIKTKDASTYVETAPDVLLAHAEAEGLKVYTWGGMSGKSQTFAIAAKGPKELQRLTGLGMSTIYGKKMAQAADALTLTACLTHPGMLLARPIDSQGAYTEAI